jgi:hypothetical protein
MNEADAMRQAARRIPVLRFCHGCDTSIVPGQRDDETGVKDPDGNFWHIRCWRAREQKPLPTTGPACIEDLYG